jgi:hypothetical protein
MPRFSVAAVTAHERGKVYHLNIEKRAVQVLVTFHVFERSVRWRLSIQAILQTLLFPEEVLRGHRDRFIAHRRVRDHVVRVIYQYDERLPVAVTVYNPYAKRYFQGGGIYEDRILT